jgi:hypothetical protein
MWTWIAILLFASVKTLNDYKIGKTLAVSLISLTTMLLCWAVVILGLVLTNQLLQFVMGSIREIGMTF